MNRMKRYPLNLQYFADGATGGETPAQEAAGAQAEAGGETAAQPDTERTFTQADVDRIVQQTIARERRRADAAVQTARAEGERLAQMTADERARHDAQERESALARREADVSRRELRAQALETLAGKGLPHELADVLNYASADECNASIAIVEKAFRVAVQKGVDARMQGDPPKSGGGQAGAEAALLAQMRAAAGLKPGR